ncbi:hypothetical protein CYMTET_44954 [Cymbomonas tetramitiformis]|uniref:Uncharacterized protein n=1 Tax=Cymbomonas tetramitiformis TaxID=36881 RepID=A0AAE0BZ72_9CHLO|nr:hypothetical protein CYMTET_44954 [Cymbomonas tetramitiformis]
MPVDDEGGAAEAMHTLALCHIFQLAADERTEAFAAAVQEYGAPAVLAGDESGGIDVPACVKTMDEKVQGVQFAHTSLVANADASRHFEPTGSFFGGSALAAGMPQQVVPGAAGSVVPAPQVPHGGTEHAELRHHGMSSRVSAGAPSPWRHHLARISPPTVEEFPGGVERVLVAGAFDLPFSAGACSRIKPQAPHSGDRQDDNMGCMRSGGRARLRGASVGASFAYTPALFGSLSPGVQERLMQVLGSALTAEPQGFGHGGMLAEASGYGGVATTAEP